MTMFYSLGGLALAQAQQAPQAGTPPIWANPLFMMGIIFAIIYFLIMRPQQKKQREHQNMLHNLKRGDKVVTLSGIYGTVTALDEKIVSLQVDDKVRIKMNRTSVAALSQDDLSS